MDEKRKLQGRVSQQRYRERLKAQGITEASFKVTLRTYQNLCRLAHERFPADGPYTARSKLLEALVNG